MNEWVLRIVLATDSDISDASLDKMSDRADERDATVARSDRPSGVVIAMDGGDTPEDSLPLAVRWAVAVAIEAGGCEDVAPVDIRLVTGEIYEAEALKPDIEVNRGQGDRQPEGGGGAVSQNLSAYDAHHLNRLAETLVELYGFLPLSVRYGAAAAALAYIAEHLDVDKPPLRTSGGVELTEELIEQLVAEAEVGYDLDRLRPKETGEQ